jgi:hypothetical protein
MIAIQQSERNGKVVAATLVAPEDEIMLITDTGVLVRTRVAEIRELGRATQGVTLIAWTKAPSSSACSASSKTMPTTVPARTAKPMTPAAPAPKAQPSPATPPDRPAPAARYGPDATGMPHARGPMF